MKIRASSFIFTIIAWQFCTKSCAQTHYATLAIAAEFIIWERNIFLWTVINIISHSIVPQKPFGKTQEPVPLKPQATT